MGFGGSGSRDQPWRGRVSARRGGCALGRAWWAESGVGQTRLGVRICCFRQLQGPVWGVLLFRFDYASALFGVSDLIAQRESYLE